MGQLSSTNNDKPTYPWRAIGVVVLVLLACIAAYASLAGISESWPHIAKLKADVIAHVLLLASANYLSRALRWHFFARHLNLNTSLSRDILFYVAGFAMTFSPGKVGEFIRLWFLRACYGYSPFLTFPLIIGDRVCDLMALLLIFLVAAPMPVMGSYSITASIFLLFVSLIATILRPDLLMKVTDFTYSVLRAKPRVFARMRRLSRAYMKITHWRSYAVALPLSIVGWLAEVAILYNVAEAMGASMTFASAAFVFSGATVVGALTLLPGGIGGAEISMAGLLMLSGFNLDLAAAITIVVRAVTLWFAVSLGLAALPLAIAQVNTSQAKRATT